MHHCSMLGRFSVTEFSFHNCSGREKLSQSQKPAADADDGKPDAGTSPTNRCEQPVCLPRQSQNSIEVRDLSYSVFRRVATKFSMKGPV